MNDGMSWRALPRPARWMLASLVFDFVGTGLIMPFGVVYLHEVRGFSMQTAGVLLALPAIVGLLATAPGGVLIDRLGARRVVISAVSLEIVAQILLANARSVPVAVCSFVASGLAIGVIFPAVQAMVASIMPSSQRQHYFGLNFTILNLGIGLGGLLGGAFVSVSHPASFEAIYYIDAASFLVPLCVYLFPLRNYGNRTQPTPDDKSISAEPQTGGYRAVLSDAAMRLLVALGFMTAFIGYAQFGVGFQAFARAEADVSTRTLGWAYAANTAVIVVAQLFVLKLVTRHRRTRSLLVMCALWALAWLLMGVAGVTHGAAAGILICATAAVFGLGETFLQPTLPAMVNDLAPDHLRGRYNSASAASFHLAEIIGPPVAGVMIGHGLGAGYIAVLLGGCALSALVALVAERKLTPQVNGRGHKALKPMTPEGALADELQSAKAWQE